MICWATKALGTPHHLTLYYCSCVSWVVERLGKEVPPAYEALLSDLNLQDSEWLNLFNIDQSIMNQSLSPQCKNIALTKSPTGMYQPPLITTLFSSDTA